MAAIQTGQGAIALPADTLVKVTIPASVPVPNSVVLESALCTFANGVPLRDSVTVNMTRV